METINMREFAQAAIKEILGGFNIKDDFTQDRLDNIENAAGVLESQDDPVLVGLGNFLRHINPAKSAGQQWIAAKDCYIEMRQVDKRRVPDVAAKHIKWLK